MRRLLGAAALCALLLSGCGDASENPAPSDPVTSAPADVAPTTAVADAERVTSTGAPESTTATSTPSGPAETSQPATATAAPAPPPAPTSEPSSPEPDPAPSTGECTGDRLSQDILGFPGGVEVYFCDGDWAYASYPDAPGDPEFIAQRVDGRWFHAVAIGDPVCREDLAARGAPPTIAKLLPGCDELPPTDPPTSAPPTTAPPQPDCVINTVLYGDTYPELIGVSCADATAEWELAEANADPSWTVPWITPTGWECFVTPYDPTSKAAGACYGPDGHAYFTLYLP
ncbi:hypothetical protein MWU75_06275 [Ornithinimicrobium sp. F0845]|uniref:hypothetical protein n=1 Tax=Ornithinimicrobium sp. F0845 TaxID=2926412 RepID=UPI001FF5CFDD|nr:hypothetical protein [Ornithinimicrobium sp. F0845]MCK0111741.1 hypothetical protein [Ornithinimicrobium sp. F0845]